MQNSPLARFGYVYGLDGLRLLAVSVVVIRHFNIVQAVPGGFGVSIFFFISGFLISRLLLAEEHRYKRPIGLKSFYIRRFIRLLPPLMLMGIVCVPVLYVLRPEQFSVLQVVLSFTYFGNLLGIGQILWGWPSGYEALGPLWSLAVEEHFYLLLPFALLLFKGARTRLFVVAVAVVVPLALRVWIFYIENPLVADRINYNFTLTRIDAIAWGVLLTLMLEQKKIRPPTGSWIGHLLVWGGGCLMVASMVHWTEAYEIAWKYTFQSIAIGIFVVGVLFAFNYAWLRALLEKKPVVHLGRISYELYLWHLPVYTIAVYFITNSLLAVFAALAVTVLVADVAYRLTTKRLSGVRKRFGGHPTE
jgi:peptidoglycan/LPS O-acetylase OafA/YrhL